MLAKLTTGAFLAASNVKESFIKQDAMPIREMPTDNETNMESYWNVIWTDIQPFTMEVKYEGGTQIVSCHGEMPTELWQWKEIVGDTGHDTDNFVCNLFRPLCPPDQCMDESC